MHAKYPASVDKKSIIADILLTQNKSGYCLLRI